MRLSIQPPHKLAAFITPPLPLVHNSHTRCVFITSRPAQRFTASTTRRASGRIVRCSNSRDDEREIEGDDADDEIPVELVEGHLENTDVRPKLDMQADEYMVLYKLRRMLHKDDFKRIFDERSRRIGEI